nr:Rrf2 family transcriptional regulator [Acidimicrobiia bacterium]
MWISRRTDYATRAVLALAISNSVLNSQALAERVRVPESFMKQIMMRLRDAGVVRSVRGPSGGYRLNHAPSEITLGRVVRIFEGQLARAEEEAARLARKEELLAGERRRAEEEIARLEARQAEARESIAALEARQAEADVRFNDAQRRLFEARERIDGLSARAAEARATHAALVEREAALGAEVGRLEEQAREIEARVDALGAERTQKAAAREALETETAEAVARLDAAVAALDGLRADVQS